LSPKSYFVARREAGGKGISEQFRAFTRRFGFFGDELIRSGDEETINLSKYQFGVYEPFRRSQLCSYMLYLVRNGEVETKFPGGAQTPVFQSLLSEPG